MYGTSARPTPSWRPQIASAITGNANDTSAPHTIHTTRTDLPQPGNVSTNGSPPNNDSPTPVMPTTEKMATAKATNHASEGKAHPRPSTSSDDRRHVPTPTSSTLADHRPGDPDTC